MVRHATSSPGAASNSSYASDKSEPNALERLMAQLMNSPLTTVENQMFDLAVGTPVRRHESFSSGTVVLQRLVSCFLKKKRILHLYLLQPKYQLKQVIKPFKKGGSTPPTTPPTPTSYSSSKQPKVKKTTNRGSNKGRPRLDSTSSLNKTPGTTLTH